MSIEERYAKARDEYFDALGAGDKVAEMEALKKLDAILNEVE